MLRAIMDISARAFSLRDRPQTGQMGHQGSQALGRPVLHLVSSSRRPRQENGTMSSLSPDRCSSFVRAVRPVPSFSNRRHKRKRFLSCFLVSAPFFCSTAPQAFFRPDRRFRTPARAEAVKAGRRSAVEAYSDVSRPRLDSLDHGGRLEITGRKSAWFVEFGSFAFSLASIDVAARSTVLNAVQGRWPHHGLRVSTPLCPERTWQCTKNRAVIEARPGRDNVPPRDAAKGYSINLRRLEMQPQRSIGTSCRWSTCGAGLRQACWQPPSLPS